MEQLPAIKLVKGATSTLEVDLTDFDFQGGKVVLSLGEVGCEPLRSFEFTEAGKHAVVFEDEFTAQLKTFRNYQYDVMWHIDGERFAQCAPSPVEVSNAVGGYPYGTDG